MLRTVTLTVALVSFVSAALAADGAAVYKANCAKCHGDTGKGDTPAGKAMKMLAFDATLGKQSPDDIAAKVKANPKHASVVKAVGDDLPAAAAHVKEIAK
jgi:mono/diheme cytochrome c family protein